MSDTLKNRDSLFKMSGQLKQRRIPGWRGGHAGMLALLLALGACASAPLDEEAALDAEYGIAEETAYDPLEPMNRAIFAFNEVADTYVMKPVAIVYRDVVPEGGRTVVRNVLRNLSEPLVFANSLLQLDGEHALTSFWRFTLNSTFGLLGMRDFATDFGLNYRAEDFGQTLGSYGVGEGPYLVLPLLGPSNLRDLVGLAADYPLDAFDHVVEEDWQLVRTLTGAVDTREALLRPIDDIYETSLDPYATFRSGYAQRRRDAVANGKQEGVE